MWGRGTVLGDRYTLAERIGGGGMGEVWRADDGVLRRQVAVKVLLPALLDDPAFAARFRREATVLASLSHPGIVDVHDYGESRIESGEQVAYIVMELIEGRPLNEVRAQSGPLPAEQALDIAGQALDALHAAHLRGVTHRDIKPSNLMLGEGGRVTVTDFGIARSSAASTGITDSHAVLGTALYMAPEQAEGLGAIAASDVYSMGVVCYELLTGEPPFTGESVVEIALKHIREPVPDLPGEFPEPVRAFVARALAKKPEERYADASVMAAAARRAAAGRPLGKLDAPARPTDPAPVVVAVSAPAGPGPAGAAPAATADGVRRRKWWTPLRVPAVVAVPIAVTVTITVSVAVTVLYIDPGARRSEARGPEQRPSATATAPVPGSGSPAPGTSPSGSTGRGSPGASAPPPGVNPGENPGGQGADPAAGSGGGGAAPAPNTPLNPGGSGDGGSRASAGPSGGAGGGTAPGGGSTPGTGSGSGGSTPPKGCGGGSWGAITNVGDGLRIGLSTGSPQAGAKVVMGGTTSYGWVHEKGSYDTLTACASGGSAMSRALTQFGDTVRVELSVPFAADVWWNLEKAPTAGAYYIKDIHFQGGCLTDNGAGSQLTVVACSGGASQQWRIP
ncbi:serine/threonine-protein kinase [Streptomyces sp. NBC_01565]|uniref:serine/threonine-protein kinase n=1 Tax=Streptomyces sp. NBC_01565 TaxID=2975881 RepID=UPI00224F4188|nr:serine/threonine-protein kinase [Streptomyces sp. NBC_01565]MCX4545510.1 protein kinase [Streptomyces sp. NBC_01565]